MTISQVEPVFVTFAVPATHLPTIKAHSGGREKLSVVATPQDAEAMPVEGQLTFLDSVVDSTTDTIKLKATFTNADHRLWPGQFVDVELILSEQKDALLVPSTAIQVGQAGSYVFIVTADGTAEIRPVVVDRMVGDDTVVASGLNGGETVIVDGHIRVVPGAKVAPGAKS
jgi:multidrug efflux system membrane fusion protein